MILLKSYIVLSKTQVPKLMTIQIIVYISYSTVLIFFKRTNEPKNHVSLNLKDRDLQ